MVLALLFPRHDILLLLASELDQEETSERERKRISTRGKRAISQYRRLAVFVDDECRRSGRQEREESDLALSTSSQSVEIFNLCAFQARLQVTASPL